jgi:hypothetical protein
MKTVSQKSYLSMTERGNIAKPDALSMYYLPWSKFLGYPKTSSLLSVGNLFIALGRMNSCSAFRDETRANGQIKPDQNV